LLLYVIFVDEGNADDDDDNVDDNDVDDV